jgi:RecB family endonuclease NucS
VINGGGRIQREYGLGRRALDILIEWKDARYAIEVKVRRGKSTEARGVQQLSRYLDQMQLTQGWLVLFDMRKLRWEKKLYQREVEYDGKRIWIVGS